MRHATGTRTPKPRQPIRILNPEAKPRMTTAIEPPAEIRTDPEFEKLMPPLSAEELAQLEANVVSEGCRDAIATWDGILVDGHNRLAICRRHGLPYRTVALDFADRSAALEWIVKNQFGRRNISALVRIELATRLEEIYSARARENQRAGGKLGGRKPAGIAFDNVDESLMGATREAFDNVDESLGVPPEIAFDNVDESYPAPVHARAEAARDAGVSEGTYRKGKAVLENAPPELVDKVRRGEVSINAAYNEVAPPRPTGQCRVNGVLVPDTPDVARARKAGRIGPDVIPDVEDPGDGDDMVTFSDEPEAPAATQTDEEWFATLPAWHKLGPGARVLFERDALAYRACEEARGRFAHAVRSVLASASRKGSLPTFCHRLRGFLKINHPKHWTLCPPPEHGGCGGTGVLDITGTCTKCFGGGYQI